MIYSKYDARRNQFVPGNLVVALGFLMLLAIAGCRSAPEKKAPPPQPPPLALETFDEAWRIIYEHHFDTNFNGVNWLKAREKFRPRVARAGDAQEVRDIIQEMLDLLDVSHLSIIPSEIAEEVAYPEDDAGELARAEESNSGTAGMEVRVSDNRLVVFRVEENSLAAQIGVKPGWLVEKIEDQSVADLIEKFSRTMTGPKRDFLIWRRASGLLEGPPGSTVTVSLLDENNEKSVLTLERKLLPGEPVKFGSLPVLYADLQTESIQTKDQLEIGLIRFNIWMLPTAIAFNKAINDYRQADGIIIDLRGNVGGVIGMIIGVAGHFFEQPRSLGTLITRDNRLNLFVNPRLVNAAGKRVQPYSGPVAILVDEVSASASEVFAGGMKELKRAGIFGRRTSGQALPAVYDRLPNGDALYHPFGDFVTETGVRFEGRGVIPDEEFALKRQALLQGKDAPLEAAIKWMTKLPK